MSKLTVCIVTWNSEKYIENCLKNLIKQSYVDYKLLIIDNNSSDNTLKIIKEIAPNANIIENKTNLGFCGGHNLGIKLSNSKYYMPFNPDIVAEQDFLSKMVEAIEVSDDNTGAVSGKLLRYDSLENKKTKIIDSTGIYFKKNRRSLDRGAEELDVGQYETVEYVFGSSGAAPLYKKEMLEDIKIDDQYFLEYFFAYREDVDLAWRAQHRAWKCIYYPHAVAYHVRNNTPLKRKQMSEFVNMHSVKNRLLMLLQNESKYGFFVDGWKFVGYDIMIFIYIIFKERSSIPAFTFVMKNFKEIMKVRKQILRNSKIKSSEINKWFGRINSLNS